MAPTSDHLHPASGRKEPCLPRFDFEPNKVAVVMVPLPAQGHLNQLLHLSRLISSYGIPVHYVAATTHINQAKLRLHGWDPSSSPATDGKHPPFHFHCFDIPPFPSPSADPNSTSKFPSQLIPAFEAAASHLRLHVAALVRSLATGSARRVVVIHDSLMASAVQDTVSVSNAESYIFHSVSAFSVYWYLVGAPVAGELPLGEDGSICLGEPPRPEDCFTAEFLEFVQYQYKFRNFSSGYLYNTSRAVEGVFMKLLAKARGNTDQPHWAVGPFNPVSIPSSSTPARDGDGRLPQGGKHKCIEWLNRQPLKSVIYVSFGTTVALNQEQIHEIARGLEASGQRFIWVLREADKGDNSNNGVKSQKPAKLSLPRGFEERFVDVGLVVREWAPQLEILGHPAVGGFMSHCGWNSCMESISMGVPIVAWPMHSDQPSNSTLLTKILKIGILVEEWSNLVNSALVKAASIERAVSMLMSSEEGDIMRKRAAKLHEALRSSVDDGGFSRAELESFIAHITR